MFEARRAAGELENFSCAVGDLQIRGRGGCSQSGWDRQRTDGPVLSVGAISGQHG